MLLVCWAQLFDHAQCSICFKLLFDFFHSVDRYWSWSMKSRWFSSRINMDTNGWSCHHVYWLVWAVVECGCKESFEKPLFHFIVIFFNGLKWEIFWSAWRRLSLWAVACWLWFGGVIYLMWIVVSALWRVTFVAITWINEWMNEWMNENIYLMSNKYKIATS